LQEAGIQPTARHANPLVFAEAMFVSVNTAINGPLKEMQQGRLGVGCRPNADSYNCIIMVRLPMQLTSIVYRVHADTCLAALLCDVRINLSFSLVREEV